jgi:hypothetical protein
MDLVLVFANQVLDDLVVVCGDDVASDVVFDFLGVEPEADRAEGLLELGEAGVHA